MVSDPSTGEIWTVRLRLKKIGDTTTVLSDAAITQFWKENVEIAQTEVGKTYDSSNYLWIRCISLGVCRDQVMNVGAAMMVAKRRMLGKFSVDEQGLNWNVGIFQGMQMTFDNEYQRCIDLLSDTKYKIVQRSFPNSLHKSLADIVPEAGFY